MKRALVLSGGGGKGAYQLGVWKALRKLKINFDIVTGTSIGALNGALIAQNDYFSLWYLWQKTNFETLFGYELENDVNTYLGKKETIKMYKEGILKDKGMTTIHIEKLVKRFVNEKKIRNSKIDYGLVAFNLTDFEEVALSKKDIPDGKIADFAVASATCFPAFQIKEIDDKKYIDGGYYDNLPINLSLDMGAQEIIAVDLGAIGMIQDVKDKSIKITTIKPNNELCSFLVFDPKKSRKNIIYGYNDTMKVFGYLDGEKYTFQKNSLERNYNLFIDKIKEKIFGNIKSDFVKKMLTDSNINDILSNNDKKFDEIVEFLGYIYNIEDSKVYNPSLYNKKIKKEFSKRMEEDLNDGKELFNIKEIINDNINRKIITYFYNNPDLNDLFTRRLALIFTKQYVASIYLKVI